MKKVLFMLSIFALLFSVKVEAQTRRVIVRIGVGQQGGYYYPQQQYYQQYYYNQRSYYPQYYNNQVYYYNQQYYQPYVIGRSSIILSRVYNRDAWGRYTGHGYTLYRYYTRWSNGAVTTDDRPIYF